MNRQLSDRTRRRRRPVGLIRPTRRTFLFRRLLRQTPTEQEEKGETHHNPRRPATAQSSRANDHDRQSGGKAAHRAWGIPPSAIVRSVRIALRSLLPKVTFFVTNGIERTQSAAREYTERDGTRLKSPSPSQQVPGVRRPDSRPHAPRPLIDRPRCFWGVDATQTFIQR